MAHVHGVSTVRWAACLAGTRHADRLLPSWNSPSTYTSTRQLPSPPWRQQEGEGEETQLFFVFCFLFFLSFCLLPFFVVVVVAISWAAPAAYGGSQARG